MTNELPEDLYKDAVKHVRTIQFCGVSSIQRKFRIGYTTSARIVDRMEAEGLVGPYEGPGTQREVLMEKERRITHNNADALIDEWHDGDSQEPLHDFLGLTIDEYKRFVRYSELPGDTPKGVRS